MKTIIQITILILLLLSNGCANMSHVTGKDNSLISDVYRQAQKDEAIEQQVKLNNTLGYVKPYVPVINPPEVKRAWVVPHKTEDGSLIGGYWVYVIVKDASWYIGTPQMNMPAITIPYKQGKQEIAIPKSDNQSSEGQTELTGQ